RGVVGGVGVVGVGSDGAGCGQDRGARRLVVHVHDEREDRGRPALEAGNGGREASAATPGRGRLRPAVGRRERFERGGGRDVRREGDLGGPVRAGVRDGERVSQVSSRQDIARLRGGRNRQIGRYPRELGRVAVRVGGGGRQEGLAGRRRRQ